MVKIFKKSLIFLCILGTSMVYAQKPNTTHHSADTSKVAGEHGVGWIRSQIMDNWFINLDGGVFMYNGYEDNLGPIKDRITGTGELYIGRWIFPMVGVRIGGGWTRSHGFVSTADYNAYHPNVGYGESEGVSPNALGGYYWSYGDDNQLYIQKWDHIFAGGDLLVNFSLFRNYHNIKFDRKWHNIGYMGVTMHHGLCEEHPEVPRSIDDNYAAEGHIGYMGKFLFSEHLSAFVDARLSVYEGRFDREFCEEGEKLPQDGAFSVLAGLTYDFNLRNKSKRKQYYVEQGIFTETEDVTIPKYMHYVQLEEVEEILIIDTIIKYSTVYADDINTRHYVDSLQNVLDSLLREGKAAANDQPLDSIFLKNLLPYEMVFFELDKWDILPSEEMKIAKMARIIKAYPNETFLLTGSADSKTGTVKRNIFLSHNRADVVYNKLINEYDVNPDQLKREYLGGILDYDPFELNRTTVIIMDHPTVRKAFDAMKEQRKAGGGVTEF